MPDETSLEPRFVVCFCDHCGKGIEFDAVQLADREACWVPCPHCGGGTQLQEPPPPPPPPRLVPDEGWTLPAATTASEVLAIQEPTAPSLTVPTSPPELTQPPVMDGLESLEGLEPMKRLEPIVPMAIASGPAEPLSVLPPPEPPEPTEPSTPPAVPTAPPELAQPPPADKLGERESVSRRSPPPELPPLPPANVESLPVPSTVAVPAKAAEPKPIKVTLPPSPPPPVLTKAPSDVRWLTDLGVVYFRQHQFHEAYLCFRRTAEQNFAPAQFCLAVCYLNGQGTAQDEAAALPWLRRAAAQGDTNAEFTLGMAYRLGRGVPPNEELAQQWLRQAASQGHREAIRLVVGTEGGNASTQIKAAAPPPPVPVPVVSDEKAPPSKLRQDLQRMLLGLFRKK